jgi:hypothetical protein
MRWDYLYRFYERYGNKGFKLLLSQGFSCENTMLNYIPTFTAIGHSSIYTGSVPSIHGIAGNDFICQATGEIIYCTGDAAVEAVGVESSVAAGKMSPKNLQTTTITDELKLATNFRSKIIGVALKDRGSILPAGHCADAAYWYDANSGNWISSSFYMEKLPEWLQKYNSQNFPENYLNNNWNTLYPLETYVQSSKNIEYEENFNGKSNEFPILTSNLTKKEKNKLIGETPFGNTMTLDIARLAVENEQLGADNITDFLAVSLSSTDYIGHRFGINSAKIEDCYLRLDNDLANFILFLDKKIGKDNYTLFLSADHACAHNAKFLTDNKINAGIFDENKILNALNQHLKNIFNKDNIVKSLMNYQVNFDYEKCKNLPHDSLISSSIDFLEKIPSIQYLVEQRKVMQSPVPEPIKERITNGFNREFSGEIQIILKPAFYSDNDRLGCTHGTWNPHDSHIPLLFYGKGIKKGKTNRQIFVTDIAATLAAMLKIQMPNGCIGTPIEEILK